MQAAMESEPRGATGIFFETKKVEWHASSDDETEAGHVAKIAVRGMKNCARLMIAAGVRIKWHGGAPSCHS